MFRKISDITVIEGIRQQDEKTLNWLYDNYFQTIRHHVIKNSGCEDDVSDVFQESIIILYCKIRDNSFKLTTDLKGFFFSIAKNVWHSQLRHKKRIVNIEPDLVEEGDNTEYDSTLLEKIVSRSFKKLKPDAQLILTMFSEGFSFKEIAEQMNLKNETYARRKKYLSKEALIEIIKNDPEYHDYLDLR